MGVLGVRVGRRIPAVLGEWRRDDQGVGRGDGRVPADAGGARGCGGVGVRVGRRIPAVLGESRQTIKVWDVATGACLQTLEGHADWVYSVCVSADGSRLFSGSATRRSRCGTRRRARACRRWRGTRMRCGRCARRPTDPGCSRGVRQHDQGVGRGDGRVPADAGGARGFGDLGVRVGRRIPAVLGE